MAWNESKKIRFTIDSSKILENMADFPVSVYISGTSGLTSFDMTDIFTDLGANDQKIAVYTDPGQSGGTECYVEVEFWDDAFDEALLHVRVPTVASGTDTALWLYYDSGEPDNTTYVGYPGDTVAQNVWDSGFEAVFHLANDPSGGAGSMKDSTSNNRDGSPFNMTALNLTDGDIGKAIDFDGAAEYIAFAALGSITQWTITAKFKSDVVSGDHTVCSQDLSGYNDDVLFGIEPENGYGTNNAIGCVVHNNDGSTREIVSNSVPVTTIDWYVASVRSTGSMLYLYVDGVEKDTDPGTNIGMGNNAWNIGQSTQTVKRRFDGLIEELRISSSSRNESWVVAESYSLFDDLITYDIPAFYYFDGYVKEEGIAVIRTVRAHQHDTGDTVFETTSSGLGGYFYGETSHSGTHYVLVFDNAAGASYNTLVYDNVIPTTISG